MRKEIIITDRVSESIKLVKYGETFSLVSTDKLTHPNTVKAIVLNSAELLELIKSVKELL
jgi:hypothetical protein